ncbi:hypothetical protein ElyMa_001616000, partial [Elysia marginata]
LPSSDTEPTLPVKEQPSDDFNFFFSILCHALTYRPHVARLSIREESESRPDSRRVKSNTRRSPAERGHNGKLTGKDKNKNLKAEHKPSRSKSRQGVR